MDSDLDGLRARLGRKPIVDPWTIFDPNGSLYWPLGFDVPKRLRRDGDGNRHERSDPRARTQDVAIEIQGDPLRLHLLTLNHHSPQVLSAAQASLDSKIRPYPTGLRRKDSDLPDVE